MPSYPYKVRVLAAIDSNFSYKESRKGIPLRFIGT